MCGAGKLSDSGSPLAEFLNGLETFCIMVFTVEYVLRILTCTTKMRIHHFVLAPMNVIGLIAILPWYLDLVLAVLKVEVSVEALSLLRVVRLTRVVRIFKKTVLVELKDVLRRCMDSAPGEDRECPETVVKAISELGRSGRCGSDVLDEAIRDSQGGKR